jgi:ABC-2 type transport system permease protein
MSFLCTFKNEAKFILTNIAIMLTVIGGVVLYSVLYPQPYAKQSVSKLSVSVVDHDKSDMSRDLMFKLNATAQIQITRHDLSDGDAKEALKRGDIKGIIIIPRHFKKDLALNKSPTIAVGADSSYFLIFGAVVEGAMKSIFTQIATIKVAKQLKKDVPLASAKNSYLAYSINVINLFNKGNSYIQYVVPAVFILVLQQTMLIGMGILGGEINERMGRREEEYFKIAPVWQMLLSRFIIFGTIYFILMLYYFGMVFDYYDITRLADISDLLTFGIAFLFASLSFGAFLGSLFRYSEAATPTILFSSLPLVFSAGFVWPLESLPAVMHYASLLVPSTPAIHGFVGLNQLGADFDMIVDSYAILWLQTLAYLSLAYFISVKKRKTFYYQGDEKTVPDIKTP